MIHPSSDVKASSIGEGTRVWQYVVILPGAVIGRNCNINAHCFIENRVVIGDNVTLKCGVYVWDEVTIGNNVFVGPNVSFVNDRFPRSKQHPDKYQPTVIEDGASLGAGCVILSGLTIGRNAMIGAGSVVTRNVPPNQVWVGNPAHFLKEI
jgi:UDP-2-acetamido-3-amino-2,3-dideoxy-glucuronate N-acetyltransferase